MDKRDEIIAGAMRLFDAEGFRGIGIDRVIAPSGASTRTLYKHFGSRDGLVIAVLEQRHHTFMAQLQAQPLHQDPVGVLFDVLGHWIELNGARGCMLLRALSEYACANEEIVLLVHRQKNEYRARIALHVREALGREDPALSTQVWLLLEGATTSATVAEAPVIEDARQAALALVAVARARAS